jgi:streptomycin 6-kinase
MRPVRPLPLPELLAAAAAREGSGELRGWVERLPQVVAGLCERWSLQPGQPYQPGGHCSWVAPARRSGAGQPPDDVVLKVGWLHSEAVHEAAALRLWDGDGAVTLLAEHTDGQTCALLLERCLPGTPLRELVTGPEQDVIVAGLLRRLWRQPAPGHPFRPLQQMCDQWAKERDWRHGAVPVALDPGLTRAGLDLLRALPASADRQVLLCTDLHTQNILAAQRAPWLAIDPKPYLGDPAYDATQHMLNCEDRLGPDPLGLVGRMAGLLDLDPGRLRLWLFARCALEYQDWPGGARAAATLAP